MDVLFSLYSPNPHPGDSPCLRGGFCLFSENVNSWRSLCWGKSGKTVPWGREGRNKKTWGDLSGKGKEFFRTHKERRPSRALDKWQVLRKMGVLYLGKLKPLYQNPKPAKILVPKVDHNYQRHQTSRNHILSDNTFISHSHAGLKTSLPPFSRFLICLSDNCTILKKGRCLFLNYWGWIFHQFRGSGS